MQSPNLPKSILNSLKKISGEDGVSFKKNHRIAYARDCSTASLIEIREGKVSHPPELIVWPRNSKEVSEVLKIANESQIPLVPYGAGSGVCGGAVPLKGGIVLDLKKMDRILSLDKDFLRVRAQTGILGELLERSLKKEGLTLGHFPSSIYTATLGGFIACRSAGQLSTKYGKIEDMVRSLQVCLADGRIIELGSKGSMDLKELFLGSEGTLGVVTEATLALHPAPESEQYRGIRFPCTEKGIAAIRRFLQAGTRPAVVRLYDPLDTMILLSQSEGESASLFKKIFDQLPPFVRHAMKNLQSGSLRWLLSQSPFVNRVIDFSLSRSLLIMGFEGPAWKVKAETETALRICKEEGGEDLGEEVGLQWLRRRYSLSYMMSPIVDQGCFADTMEVAAPWNRLPSLYHAVREAIQRHALVMAHFSHAYTDGCSIYFIFSGYGRTAEESLSLHRKIWRKALRVCLEHGGTISHHHGVGSLKAEAFVEELGPLHGWLRKVKQKLDPNGILNPGKMGL